MTYFIEAHKLSRHCAQHLNFCSDLLPVHLLPVGGMYTSSQETFMFINVGVLVLKLKINLMLIKIVPQSKKILD